MLLLALDSSSTASVALARLSPDEHTGYRVEILASRESEDTRSHAELMAPFVSEVLDEAQVRPEELDAILTGTGPGPFTGLRAGIMTARTLSFAWSKPVFGLMSLYALAEHVYNDSELSQQVAGHEFMVASDARRREIYTALFSLTENGYSCISGPSVHPAAQAPAADIYGYGAGLYEQTLTEIGARVQPGENGTYNALHPNASDLLHAAARIAFANGFDESLSALSTNTSALYLRESDAKVPASMLARAQAAGTQKAGA